MTASPEEKRLTTLRWFVFRARRVAEHSLARNQADLLDLASGRIEVTVVDGRATMDFGLPDEEAFESLAGRCRPFMMERDALHHTKVIAALRPYLADDTARCSTLDALAKSWAGHNSKSKHVSGFGMRTGPADGDLGELVADNALADAWLFCDFGHGDTDVTSRVGDFALDDRFRAAVFFVAGVAVESVKTLNFIHECSAAGLVPIEQSAFTEPVLASKDFRPHVTAMAQAPAGTPIQDLEAALDQLTPRQREDE